MALLSKSDLLKVEELKKEKVDLGNGDYVFVRQMTGRERDRFEQSLLVEKKSKSGEVSYERNLDDYRAKLVVNTICDEEGKLILTLSDASTLSQNMSAFKLEHIVNKAQALNKITEEDKQGLLGNSEGAQSEDSTSDSVKN